MIKSGIASKSETIKETCTCDFETNGEEKTSSTYDNEFKGNAPCTFDK